MRPLACPLWNLPCALGAALVVAGLSACAAGEPNVDDPRGRDAGAGDVAAARTPVTADGVVAYADGPGAPLRSCNDSLTGCEPQSAAACPPAAALLGAPDGRAHALGVGSSVELTFRCRPLLERGGDVESIDVRVVTVGGANGNAVVEVSSDGRTYKVLGPLRDERTVNGFDISRTGVNPVRFMRITGSEGTVMVDAVTSVDR